MRLVFMSSIFIHDIKANAWYDIIIKNKRIYVIKETTISCSEYSCIPSGLQFTFIKVKIIFDLYNNLLKIERKKYKLVCY